MNRKKLFIFYQVIDKGKIKMKYYYSISYINSDTKERIHSNLNYNKIRIINEYINLLINNHKNVSELKIYKTNANTNNRREITAEVNKFLYK